MIHDFLDTAGGASRIENEDTPRIKRVVGLHVRVIAHLDLKQDSRSQPAGICRAVKRNRDDGYCHLR